MTTTVPKFWLVGPYVQSAPDPTVINANAGVVALTTYSTLLDAQNAAKQMAAGSPSSYFVVYEGVYWTHVDQTPVQLLAVGIAG